MDKKSAICNSILVISRWDPGYIPGSTQWHSHGLAWLDRMQIYLSRNKFQELIVVRRGTTFVNGVGTVKSLSWASDLGCSRTLCRKAELFLQLSCALEAWLVRGTAGQSTPISGVVSFSLLRLCGLNTNALILYRFLKYHSSGY